MAKENESCCVQPHESLSSCRVESVLGIDDRGQMVLPKDLRRRAGIEHGDKLAVVSHERDGEICCITLIKVDSLNDMVKEVLGPVMKDIIREQGGLSVGNEGDRPEDG